MNPSSRVSRRESPLAARSFADACRFAWRFRWLFGMMMLGAASTSAAVGGQGVRDSRDLPALPKSAGWLVQERDGNLLVASGARILQEPGLVDKVGSFFLGLGYGAPAFDSAALSLMQFTPDGALDARFGNGGWVMTPLLPLRNRNRAHVIALLQDTSGRPIVVGWRDVWTAMDANVLAIIAARYTSSGTLDTSFGNRGVVTTRVDQTSATQAFAAALDGQGRLLVAGYNGGRKARDTRGSFDDWSVKSILLRHTPGGVLDASFGDRGVASQAIDPSGKDRRSGRDFLMYDYRHIKTAALVLDRQGRAVVAASNGEGPALLMRYSLDGRLDPTFGTAGIVRMSVDAGFSVSTLLWDSEGRMVAASTNGDRMVLIRYSADGGLDSAFGAGGMSSTPMSAGMRVSAALQEREGQLLVVASGENGVLLARFDRDGKPDKTFGSEGVIRSASGRSLAAAAGLAIDAAGIPTVAALSGDRILLTRYNREGPLELRK
jgi:uncharacterized delta-60 repeat protein